MPTSSPMSPEGFHALITEVTADTTDHTTHEITARLGLPDRELTSYLRRVTGRLMPIVPNEETMRVIGDIFLIGLMIGHKAGEWQERANDAD